MLVRKRFVEMENIVRKSRLQINQEKTKYMVVERRSTLKENKIGYLKIKTTNLKDWKILNI
jgi:hypothetical protein